MTEYRQEMFSKDREEVKLAIVRGIQEFAEKSEIWYEEGSLMTNMHFKDGCPLSFKPGTSDRLLFRRLVEPLLNNIMSSSEDENRLYTNQSIAGASFMGRYYYSNYEWWDQRELREAR